MKNTQAELLRIQGWKVVPKQNSKVIPTGRRFDSMIEYAVYKNGVKQYTFKTKER